MRRGVGPVKHDSEQKCNNNPRKGFIRGMSRKRCLVTARSYTVEQAKKQKHRRVTSLVVGKPGGGSGTRKSSSSARHRREAGNRRVEGRAVGLETGRQWSENKGRFGKQRKSK